MKRLLPVIALTGLLSCNQEFEDLQQPVPNNGGSTFAQVIETDANYSILRAAVNKAGLGPVLANAGARYTFFAPDDAAFTASGITAAAVNALPAAQLNAILSYHIIPQSLPASSIPTTFPNIQMPTLLPLLANNPLVKMSIFPSRRGNSLFANNIPVIGGEQNLGNGTLYKVARVVMPPQVLLKNMVDTDTSLSFLKAAIARADSGQVGINRLDSVINTGLANLTLFAPSNNAFRELLTAMGLPAAEATIGALPVTTVRGIVAYHLLGVRAFSVNLPETTTPLRTLLGAAPFPQLTLDRSTAAPRLLGAGNRGVFANFVSVDRHAVNGVLHVIDRVLLPQ